MSIKNDYFVQAVARDECNPWLLKKHYAHRLPMAIEFAYGLYDGNKSLVGVCVFGPTAPPVPITLFGKIGLHKVRELTRLVVSDDLPSNTLSYFVSQCLRYLPKPLCVVSFADQNAGHHGYIYQATNWIYTGEGGQKMNIVDSRGNPVHSLTLNDGWKREGLTRKQYMDKHSITETDAQSKYRYLYFLGTKTERANMKRGLLLNIFPYPKGDNKRYDASYEPKVQNVLF